MSSSKSLGISNFEQKAMELNESYNINRWPVNVEQIANYAGIKLRYVPLDDELSGMCFIKEHKPVVCVNAWHSQNRQRFTIAHEIGHIILHKEELKGGALVDKTITMLRRDARSASGVYRIEVEANQFAAALLMPRGFIDEYIEEHGLDYGVINDEDAIEDMARAFQVSSMAMAIRLGNIWS